MAKTKNTKGALQVSKSVASIPLLPPPTSGIGCSGAEIGNSSEGGSTSLSDDCDTEYDSDEQYDADNGNGADDGDDIVFADEIDDNDEYYDDSNDHNDQDGVNDNESDGGSDHDDENGDHDSDSNSDSTESSESLEESIESPDSITARSSPIRPSNNQSGASSETFTTFSTPDVNPLPGDEPISAIDDDLQSGNKSASAIDTGAKTGRIFYASSTVDEKDLTGHGLTQLEISLEGNSLSLRHPSDRKAESGEGSSKKSKAVEGPSKRGSSDDASTTQKVGPKKTRRAENVQDMKLKHRVDIKDKTGHLDIILPDEVDILSLVVYNSSGIKNSILLPLSDARFRKLVDQTSPPTRSKTRENWGRIRSKYFVFLYPIILKLA